MSYFEHDVKTDILDNYNTKVYPGDKIKLRLGMQLGSKEVESSPAYVRVKIKITYENIVNGQLSGIEVPAGDNLLVLLLSYFVFEFSSLNLVYSPYFLL